MNIILVGCGRQGRLHAQCLAKLQDTFNLKIVGVVDHSPERAAAMIGTFPALGFDPKDVVQGQSLSTLARELDLSDTIVDVVTTNSVHHEVAMLAAENNARGILIEKPIADTLDHARYITKLDRPIFVMENYLFSVITNFVRGYLDENNLRPRFVKTEFSKDRRRESFDGRGSLAGYVPHVFDVEMPHQIALAAHLLGPSRSVYDAWCHDMILADGRIVDHGEGAITLSHGDGATSYNFSSLQGHHCLSATYRNARIYCQDDLKVFCYFPTTVDLSGSVLIYEGEKLIGRKAFFDDSLTEALRYALACCRDELTPLNDAQFGSDVLEVITSSKELAREYR